MRHTDLASPADNRMARSDVFIASWANEWPLPHERTSGRIVAGAAVSASLRVGFLRGLALRGLACCELT
jgi:hypothetical protein